MRSLIVDNLIVVNSQLRGPLRGPFGGPCPARWPTLMPRAEPQPSRWPRDDARGSGGRRAKWPDGCHGGAGAHLGCSPGEGVGRARWLARGRTAPGAGAVRGSWAARAGHSSRRCAVPLRRPVARGTELAACPVGWPNFPPPSCPVLNVLRLPSGPLPRLPVALDRRATRPRGALGPSSGRGWGDQDRCRRHCEPDRGAGRRRALGGQSGPCRRGTVRGRAGRPVVRRHFRPTRRPIKIAQRHSPGALSVADARMHGAHGVPGGGGP